MTRIYILQGETLNKQTSQSQKTKRPGNLGENVEIYRRLKELKPGVGNTEKQKWIAKNTLNRIPISPFCFELCPMNIHRFPPFWQRGRNVSKCDKLVTITLFNICSPNMLLRSVCCQQGDKIWQKYALELWISTELTSENQFYNAKWIHFKSVFYRLVYLFTVRFLCLIVRPWDCPQTHETWAAWISNSFIMRYSSGPCVLALPSESSSLKHLTPAQNTLTQSLSHYCTCVSLLTKKCQNMAKGNANFFFSTLSTQSVFAHVAELWISTELTSENQFYNAKMNSI